MYTYLLQIKFSSFNHFSFILPWSGGDILINSFYTGLHASQHMKDAKN